MTSSVARTAFIRKTAKKVGRALAEYRMIRPGERILAGVSGGKDSFTLVDTLAQKRGRIPVPFELYAVHVDFQLSGHRINMQHLERHLAALKVPFTVIRKPLPAGDGPVNCFWCAWNRRKEMFDLADRLQCTAIALGHTQDDAVETLLMNLLFHGEVSAMPARLDLFNGTLALIRPLILLSGRDTARYARYRDFDPVTCTCPSYTGAGDPEKGSQRKFIRDLLEQMERRWPQVRHNVFRSITRIKREYLV